MINFDYVRPSTLKLAIDAKAKDPGARFIAGGTNLVDLMKKGVMSPHKLIDITKLPLAGIEEGAKSVRIGALALNSDVARHKLITERFPLLSLALKAGASAQLRNMATVGGNLMQRTRCPYFYETSLPCNKRQPGSGCGALKGYNRMHAIFGASESCIAVNPSDMNVALAALDATVVVAGPKGERRIAFPDFHRLPGSAPEKDNTLGANELIVAVEIPNTSSFTKTAYYNKIRDRASYAFALVSVAVMLDVQNDRIRQARLALGGVAHKPWRLTDTEAFLKGKQPSIDVFRQAAELSIKGARTYGHNDFKPAMTRNAIVSSLKTVSGQSN